MCSKIRNRVLFVSVIFAVLAVLHCCENDRIGCGGELLCRKCGHTIVRSGNIIRVPSSKALALRNQTIMGIPGVLIQHFKNPADEQFEVITVKSSDVGLHGNSYAKDSWFPGYRWTIAVCPKCHAHLGWEFETTAATVAADDVVVFDGLVLEYLLSEDFSDTLTVVPKPGPYHY